MADRRAALQNLAVGDIFHSRSSNGASLICIVISVSGNAVFARRITTQDDLQFDRRTGFKVPGGQSRIDCVAPLPSEIREAFVKMDRKYQRLHQLIRNGAEPDPEECKLTSDERRALLAVHQHVAGHPI